jgi:hypothetical protein
VIILLICNIYHPEKKKQKGTILGTKMGKNIEEVKRFFPSPPLPKPLSQSYF